MRSALVWAALLFTACRGHEQVAAPAASPTQRGAKSSSQTCEGDCPKGSEAKQAMNGAFSPKGDRHPGEIVNDDQVAGRTWTDRAEDVPQQIAWVELEGKWVPVVRIRITGSSERREITLFGPNDRFLETTVQAPRPRR